MMKTRIVIVVGAGLSGYFTSYLVQSLGLKVINISQDHGSWALFHGCLDVWGQSSPTRAINKLRTSHPYALAGKGALRRGIEAFRQLMEGYGYSYSGDLAKNIKLPQAGGSIRSTAYAPAATVQGDITSNGSFKAVSIPDFEDFSAEYLSSVASGSEIHCEGVIRLPLPRKMTRGGDKALDIARALDLPENLSAVLEEWAARIAGSPRLAFPAVLGYERHPMVFQAVQDALGIPIFEIPTLPPSVAGLRIERIFRIELQKRGIEMIEGKRAIGLIDGRSHGRLVAGIQIMQNRNPVTLEADAVILATGGFLNRGLVAFQDGRVQESVFDLPLSADPDRDHWTSPSFLATQPYAGFGVLVDDTMRPRGADGRPIFENLFACGGIIAGADREIEGSRQGIDLATGYCAAEAAADWIRDRP